MTYEQWRIHSLNRKISILEVRLELYERKDLNNEEIISRKKWIENMDENEIPWKSVYAAD